MYNYHVTYDGSVVRHRTTAPKSTRNVASKDATRIPEKESNIIYSSPLVTCVVCDRTTNKSTTPTVQELSFS